MPFQLVPEEEYLKKPHGRFKLVPEEEYLAPPRYPTEPSLFGYMPQNKPPERPLLERAGEAITDWRRERKIGQFRRATPLPSEFKKRLEQPYEPPTPPGMAPVEKPLRITEIGEKYGEKPFDFAESVGRAALRKLIPPAFDPELDEKRETAKGLYRGGDPISRPELVDHFVNPAKYGIKWKPMAQAEAERFVEDQQNLELAEDAIWLAIIGYGAYQGIRAIPQLYRSMKEGFSRVLWKEDPMPLIDRLSKSGLSKQRLSDITKGVGEPANEEELGKLQEFRNLTQQKLRKPFDWIMRRFGRPEVAREAPIREPAAGAPRFRLTEKPPTKGEPPKPAPEVRPGEEITPEARALVPREAPVARTMKELREVETEFPKPRRVEEFPAKPPEPKISEKQIIIVDESGQSHLPNQSLAKDYEKALKDVRAGRGGYQRLSNAEKQLTRELGISKITEIRHEKPPEKPEVAPKLEPKIKITESSSYKGERKASLLGPEDEMIVARDRKGNDLGYLWYTKEPGGGFTVRKVETGVEGFGVARDLYRSAYDKVGPYRGSTDRTEEGLGFITRLKETDPDIFQAKPTTLIPEKPKDLVGGGTTKEVEAEFGKEIDKAIGDITPQPGLSMRVKEGPPIKTESFKFSESTIESRYQGAKGVGRESIFQKVANTFISLKNKATREYEHLPRTKEFAQLRFDLLRLSKQKGVSSDRTLRAIQGITIALDKNSYDLFTRKVILDDLEAVAAKEKALPLGFTKESLAAEKGRVDAEISKHPDISAAIEKRKRLWAAIRDDYINAMDAIGFDVSKKLQNENYFRHQVLEYANAKGLRGAGKRLRTPSYRGFLKKRKGSRLDINTDYLEAEHEVMAQMLHDIEVARTIRMVERNYDISDRLKNQARKKNVPWQTLIPEGYTTWQPREGSVFYMADSIPANIAKELTAGGLEQVGISKEDIRKILAMGRKRRELAIKEEIAETLDSLMLPHADNVISQANKRLLRSWKVWTLVSPRRWYKYNFRNLTGDADAVFMGNPRSFKHVPRATRELYDVYAGDKAMSPDMKDWFERGGMQSTLQVQEMGELKKLKMFIDKYERRGEISAMPKKLWQTYWKGARLTTDFRESILRYSNYLEYLDQMKKNPEGKPMNFGASIPDEVMGLNDLKDRAFMLSNDLLGAYDRVSVMGHALREHLYPFWSWKEVNFKRYIRLFKNAADDRQLASVIGKKAMSGFIKSPYHAYRIGRFIIKALAFWGMLQVWNNLMFPEEEASLSDEQRTTPHIIFGRDEQGKILWFPRIGALGDFLEWFGLDQAPGMAKDWYNGTKTVAEIVKKMAKSFVNVAVQGVTPFIKLPFEIITRRSLFPDVFKPGTVRDRGYHIARGLGLENEYKAIMDLPMEPYKRTMPKLFVYAVDPLEGSYHDILEEKNRFMKKIGKYGEGFWINPRGNALYHFKLALRYGDRSAAIKYLKQYFALGGTEEGIGQGLQYLNPLSGLNNKEKLVFVATLSRDNKLKLVKAIRFYTEIIEGKKIQQVAESEKPKKTIYPWQKKKQ